MSDGTDSGPSSTRTFDITGTDDVPSAVTVDLAEAFVSVCTPLDLTATDPDSTDGLFHGGFQLLAGCSFTVLLWLMLIIIIIIIISF